MTTPEQQARDPLTDEETLRFARHYPIVYAAWTEACAQRDALKAELAAIKGAGEPVAWRCFHCDAVFTDRDDAAAHFGDSEFQSPACQIGVEHVRWLEAQHRRVVEDDTETLRAIRGMAHEHEEIRRRSEEEGYARGLADARKHPEDIGLYTRPCVPLTDEPELLEALKRLSFAAQTTGGVAGRDEGLCAAIDAAAAVIAKVVAHTKGAKG